CGAEAAGGRAGRSAPDDRCALFPGGCRARAGARSAARHAEGAARPLTAAYTGETSALPAGLLRLASCEASGSVKVNVVPTPGSLSTQISQPCASTIRRAIDRPRPVPVVERAVDGARKNFSNTLRRSSSLSPCTVSCTLTVATC